MFARLPMRLVFWISVLVILYTYVGYLACLMVLARVRGRVADAGVQAKVQAGAQAELPRISIIMAGRNEGARLAAKLTNLRALLYPANRLEFIVVSDGSTDQTAALLQAEESWLRPVLLDRKVGKAAAINMAVEQAGGELLVLCDVRQRIDRDALHALAAHFADPRVGAVSGELLLEEADGSPSADALGLYWRIEKKVRKLESATGSVVGVTGALYAVRRSLFVPIPADTLLDDVYVPMQVARTGYRVLFEPGARARDRIFPEPQKEFSRKVRTLTGNYQLLRKLPWLLTPANPLLLRFVSHKLLRLAVPLFLVLALISSALAGGPVYLSFLALQLLFYGLATLGLLRADLRGNRVVGTPYTFVLLNLAAVLAFRNFLRGQTESWT